MMQLGTTRDRSAPARLATLVVVAFAVLLSAIGFTVSQSAASEPDPPDERSRIIEGTPVVAGEYPHLVGIQFAQSGFEVECGGVLIYEEWVLTAAHCLVGQTIASTKVGLGSVDDQNFAQELSVSELIREPGYDPNSDDVPTNDIALLHLATPADLSNPNIGTIEFATSALTPTYGTSVVVAGWGDTIGPDTAESYPRFALKAELETVECPQDDPYVSNTTQLCADSDAGRDSCGGDSGGPLIVDGPNQLLVGLVESGPADCGVPGDYGVYQRINVHLDWIESKTGITIDRPCDGKVPTIDMNSNGGSGLGTTGDDVILGTSGDDTINGLGGNDTICGGAGNDTLFGGQGDDRLFGQAGDDVLMGSAGRDYLDGATGDDTLIGQGGIDSHFGRSGRDLIKGMGGNDFLWGGADGDRLFGNGGVDKVWGGPGLDQIWGGARGDFLYGEGTRDIIRGGGGPDVIDGGPGDDDLFGDQNQDTLTGGTGTDTFDGGDGADACTDAGAGEVVLRC